jgi:hypothetical protein
VVQRALIETVPPGAAVADGSLIFQCPSSVSIVVSKASRLSQPRTAREARARASGGVRCSIRSRARRSSPLPDVASFRSSRVASWQKPGSESCEII